MPSWKYIAAGFCIPVNIIFIVFGIVIGNPYSVTLGLLSTVLVLTPIIQDYYAKKNEKEEVKNDKETLPR